MHILESLVFFLLLKPPTNIYKEEQHFYLQTKLSELKGFLTTLSTSLSIGIYEPKLLFYCHFLPEGV